MSSQAERVFVMNSTSQFGRLVIDSLLTRLSPAQIVAGVRNPNSLAAESLRSVGLEVRPSDYDQQGLDGAFEGIDRLLLLSSSDAGQRVSHHCNVIAAAKRAEVKLIAYVSTLHADASPLKIAEDHCQTESVLRISRAPYVLLRNGLCTEDIVLFVLWTIINGRALPLPSGAIKARISSASRADYARAAAVLLASSDPGQTGRTYELAGDEAYTLPRVAFELGRQLGERLPCWRSLPERGHWAQLTQSGLFDRFSELFANSAKGAGNSGLYEENRQLNRLIGRPTTSLATTIAQLLKALRMGRAQPSFDSHAIATTRNSLVLDKGVGFLGKRRTAIGGAGTTAPRGGDLGGMLQFCSQLPVNENTESSAILAPPSSTTRF